MIYKLELLSSMNNKLSKLEFSSQPTSDFRWESEPSFDNNQLDVELNVKGDNLTEIANNVALLQSIINRARVEFEESGTTTVELRLSISSDAGVIDQIGHLEVIGGEISNHNIGDVWVLNQQKPIRLTFYTTGEFRRYASKIYNLPEGSDSIVSDINGRVGYKWINNILVNSHFDYGFNQTEIFYTGDDIDWDTRWNLYGSNPSLNTVSGLLNERAMIPPYCVQITQSGLSAGQTRGFHQIASGVDADYVMGALWYTFDEGATGNLVLELEHNGQTESTVIDLSTKVINSHPLSNGYKVATNYFDATTISGAVDYRVYCSGVGNGNVYIGGTLLTGIDLYDFDDSWPSFFHYQDYVVSGVYNTNTDDYDLWIPYVSQSYIKNRADGIHWATTSSNQVQDRNDIVVWGVPGDLEADTAIAVWFNKETESEDENIYMGKVAHKDFWDFRNNYFFKNTESLVGTNWTDDLVNGLTDEYMHNQTFARLDANGTTDGLYTMSYEYDSDIPFNLFRNTTFRAVARMSCSVASGVSNVRLGYTTARMAGANPTRIVYNPPADLSGLVDGEIQSGNDGGGTGTNHPKYWSLIDLGLIKFDVANIAEHNTTAPTGQAAEVSQSVTVYLDVDATNGTRVYLDDIFILPAEQFFYSDRAFDNVSGDWDILYSREKQYTRFTSSAALRRVELSNQDYDGQPLTVSPWLANRIHYLQHRDTTTATNFQQYFETNQDSDVTLGYGGAGGDIGFGHAGNEHPIGDIGGTDHWQASTFTGTGGNPTNVRIRLNNRIGAPTSTITWQICADGGTAPGSVLDTGTFAGGDANNYNFTPSSSLYLDNGTIYWLVLKPTVAQGADNAWMWRGLDTTGFYSGGSRWESTNSGASWTNTNGGTDDLDFTITVAALAMNTKLAQGLISAPSFRDNVEIALYLKKVGSPTDTLTVRIETDSGGSPSGTLYHPNATATISASRLSTGYRWIKFYMPGINLNNTLKWVVLSTSASSASDDNYVVWGADGSSPSGSGVEMKRFRSGAWAAESKDAVMIVGPAKSPHHLEDVMRIWLGFNPKSKFLLPRFPDPNP